MFTSKAHMTTRRMQTLVQLYKYSLELFPRIKIQSTHKKFKERIGRKVTHEEYHHIHDNATITFVANAWNTMRVLPSSTTSYQNTVALFNVFTLFLNKHLHNIMVEIMYLEHARALHGL